ncbi:unnamed protein product, partial [Mesorhabditis spiculigera]
MIPETVARREGCTRQLKRFSKPKHPKIKNYMGATEDADDVEEISVTEVIAEMESSLSPNVDVKPAIHQPSPPQFIEDDQKPSTSTIEPTTEVPEQISNIKIELPGTTGAISDLGLIFDAPSTSTALALPNLLAVNPCPSTLELVADLPGTSSSIAGNNFDFVVPSTSYPDLNLLLDFPSTSTSLVLPPLLGMRPSNPVESPLLFNDPTQSITANLLNLYRICTQDSPTAFAQPFPVNLDLGVADLISNPTLLAPRMPIGFNAPTPLSNDRDHITQMIWARKLMFHVDWLRGIPEFWALAPLDQHTLIISQYTPMIALQMIYHTYLNNSDGILYGLGAEGNMLANPLGNECTTFNNYMIEFSHKYVISAFREINLSHDEYVVFRNVFAFNTSLFMTEAGAKTVKDAHAKYAAELLAIMRQKALPFDSEAMLEKRVTTLFGVQQHILTLSHRAYRFFTQAIALNFAELLGPMTHALYFT